MAVDIAVMLRRRASLIDAARDIGPPGSLEGLQDDLIAGAAEIERLRALLPPLPSEDGGKR